jgi:hypothetical protein
MSLARDKNVPAPIRPITAAVQAIALLTFVVLFNLGLYVLVIVLVDNHWIESESVYPPLVLFLSFALSIGIILIVLLHERVDTRNAQNPFLKKIGFTPIMVIVAAILSILATLTPAANNIVPSPDYSKKFMLANFGLTCSSSSKRQDPPQASDLIVTIYSPSETYINDVKKFLDTPKLMQNAKEKKFHYLKQDPSDKSFKLLRDYSKLPNSSQSASLSQELRDPTHWLAYQMALQDAGTRTFIPIPTKYERPHTTRIFVVAEQFPDTPQPEVAALAGSTQSLSAVNKNIVPVFQVEIDPRKPDLTDLNVEVITDHNCWHGALK